MSHLRDVDVDVFPNGHCGEMEADMDDSMICAGYFSGGKVNLACFLRSRIITGLF